MATKDASTIASNLIEYLQEYRPDIDVSSGNVVKDVVVDSVANTLELAYLELDNIRKSMSISYATELSKAQISDLAANWGLTRLAATKAEGEVTFVKFSKPTSTIRIGNIDGTGGVVVSTQRNVDGSYYSFVTTETVYLTPSTTINLETGYYEATAAVEAQVAGSGSNVSVGSINVSSGVVNVDQIVNRAALTNGTDEESNTDLIARIITASQARLLGTAPGYEALITTNDNVVAAVVLTPGEANTIRNSYGNEVDIIVRGEDLASASQIETFNSVDGLTVYFNNTPINSVSSIIGQTLTYVEDVDYILIEDDYSEYRGSNQAYDKIVWLSGGNLPYVGESYSISYTYNKLIDDLQDTVDLDTNKLIAADILVREAEEVLVDIAFTCSVYSGTDKTYAAEQIESVLATYIAGLGLGSRLEQSDLVFELRDQLSFIDNVILPFTTLCVRGSSGVADIQGTKLQYFSTDSDSFTITVN